MAHQQATQLVATGDDLVSQDPFVAMPAVFALTQFIERADGVVARAVGVMHRRSIDRLTLLVEAGQSLRNAERFAVANHHAANLAGRAPGPDPGVHAAAFEADLILRTTLMLQRVEI